MASLRTELAGKLDVSSVVATFRTGLETAVGSLKAVKEPPLATAMAVVDAELKRVDLASLAHGLQTLAGGLDSVARALPIAAGVIQPLTDALDTIETLVANPEVGDLEARLATLVSDLAGILDGPREAGVLGALHSIALALGDARETTLVKDLVARLAAAGGVSLPAVPVADAIRALDGAVRVIGGLMVLDSVTADVERLTRLMEARLDRGALDHELAVLEAALTLDGGELSAAMASVDTHDLARVQRIVSHVVACAAALDRLRDEYAAAMGFGEATLVHLDVDALARELDGARILIRTGDLAPLTGLCTQLAGAVQPFLRPDVLAGATQPLDTLLAGVEARLNEVAGRITAIDVGQLVQPLDEGLRRLTAPVDRLHELLDEVRGAYEAALGAARDGVTALPVPAVASAIRDGLAPLERAVDGLQTLVTGVLASLQTAADAARVALAQVDGHVDALGKAVSARFDDVKTFAAGLPLDQALGAVEDNVRALATALEQARMEPYFTAAAASIDTAAGVIAAVPLDRLPASMKADVDAAVAPIKRADAAGFESDVRSLLGLTGGHFAGLASLDQTVTKLREGHDALIAEVRKHEPRQALQAADARLRELAERIAKLSPGLTLQPVRDAIEAVKRDLAALDVSARLAPVQRVFDDVVAGIEDLSPAALLGDVETRIAAVRAKVASLLRLSRIDGALDDLHARAVALLDRYDADLVQQRLELAVQEFIDLADRGPRLPMMSGLGAVVAGLLDGLGLRVRPHAFESVLRWLGGASASADLNARVVAAGAAVAAARATVDSLDFRTRTASAAARVTRVRAAIPPLILGLGGAAAAAPVPVLAGAERRLDATATFAFLETNRARFAAELAAATQRVQLITQAGFSDADVRVADLRDSIAPLDPARGYVRRLLQRVGLSGFELGLAGVLRALLAVVPPSRLVALTRPIFDALHGQALVLVDAVGPMLRSGVKSARAALDAVDVTPLRQALETLHAEVLEQIRALAPDAVLGPTVAKVTDLQQTLLTGDPLAPAVQIANDVRDAAARTLARLSLDAVLATPLAVYDDLLDTLSKVDVAHAVAPLRAQLDDIAAQVDDGLHRTVDAFRRLQAALPEPAAA